MRYIANFLGGGGITFHLCKALRPVVGTSSKEGAEGWGKWIRKCLMQEVLSPGGKSWWSEFLGRGEGVVSKGAGHLGHPGPPPFLTLPSTSSGPHSSPKGAFCLIRAYLLVLHMTCMIYGPYDFSHAIGCPEKALLLPLCQFPPLPVLQNQSHTVNTIYWFFKKILSINLWKSPEDLTEVRKQNVNATNLGSHSWQ